MSNQITPKRYEEVELFSPAVEGYFQIGHEQIFPLGQFHVHVGPKKTDFLNKINTAPMAQRSKKLIKDIQPLTTISPKFISAEIDQFYKSALDPLVQQIISGDDSHFGALIDDIKNAKAVDPAAKSDHTELDNLLKALTEHTTSKFSVVTPQHLNGIYGILNKTGNDCFISSILQLIVHTPQLSEKVITHCPTIGAFVQNYEKGIDSQKLRNAFNALFFKNSNPSSQEDMAEYLGKLLAAIGFKYEVDKIDPQGQGDIGPIIPLKIDFGTLSEHLTHTILSHNVTFQSNPQNLIFHLDRTSSVELEQQDTVIYKDDRIANIPTRFDHEGTDYELTYASLHEGSNKSGHYTSLIKKEEQWHLVNDSQICALDDETAQELINSKGCLFHYKKTSPPEVVIAPPLQEEQEIEPVVAPQVQTTLTQVQQPIVTPQVVAAPQPTNTQPSLLARANWGLICALPVISCVSLSLLGLI